MAKVGLRLQAFKCLYAANPSAVTRPMQPISVGREEVLFDSTGEIKVLGCLIQLDGGDLADTELRVTKVWQCFWSLRRFVLRRDLP
eukprot:10147641-Alexandrium_andersonii.AAC.1